MCNWYIQSRFTDWWKQPAAAAAGNANITAHVNATASVLIIGLLELTLQQNEKNRKSSS